MQQFEGTVQLVFYPFVLNPTSEVATQAAWCAGEQASSGYTSYLYRRQELWSHLAAPLDRVTDFAKDVQGVDTAALKSCVEATASRRTSMRIKPMASKCRSSTPTMFINETRVVGTRSEVSWWVSFVVNRVQRTS